MKKIKKLLAVLVAMTMVMAMGMTAMAAVTTDSGKGGSASITITLPIDPNAGADGYTEPTITYTVYKVFDATSAGGTSTAIAYQIDSTNGDLTAAMTAAGFSVDTAGNVSGPASLNDAALTAIAAYAKDSIGTFTAKPSDGTLTITGLQYGYYYITTTTGAAVTVDSTNPNAEVEDKNAIPTPPDKKITGVDAGSFDEAGQNAIAQVGTKVTFTATITKVKGATNYVFHDAMSTGLSYNSDVKVTVGGSEVAASTTVNTEADNETFTNAATGSDTITLTFDNDWLAALADNTVITITYSATVTSDALTTDPANNTASLSYGDGNTTDTDTVNVYNAKFTVTKQDDKKQPLAGAGFVIAKSVADTSEGAAEGATKLQYYKLENNVVSWVDDIAQATEYTSDAQGAVKAFTGLANGTYTLIEKTVPAGYNKAADQDFTIAEGNYTAANLEQTATITNNSGTELPSTGGMGTTIFYALGAVLVLGAGVLMVTRRRMAN